MYSPAAIIRVTITFGSNVVIDDFSSKIVKTLLIAGNRDLSRIFSRARCQLPKPIHITPLYTIDGDKIKALYPYVLSNESTAKPTKKARSIVVPPGKRLLFYVSSSIDYVKDLVDAVSSIPDRVRFKDMELIVNNVAFTFSIVDIIYASRALTELFSDGSRSNLEMKIVFGSPTVFRDPLSITRRKYKVLMPMLEVVFDIPSVMTLIDGGSYRRSLFLKFLRLLRSVMSLSYSALKTVKLVWYRYNGGYFPALIGYLKLMLNSDALNKAETLFLRRYGASFIDLLSRVIIYARIYGVGNGRTAGFGHIASIAIGSNHIDNIINIA